MIAGAVGGDDSCLVSFLCPTEQAQRTASSTEGNVKRGEHKKIKIKNKILSLVDDPKGQSPKSKKDANWEHIMGNGQESSQHWAKMGWTQCTNQFSLLFLAG